MLPSDPRAESAVVGSLLVRPAMLGDVAHIVAADDFYVPAHRALYAALLRLADRGEPIDSVTLLGELERAGELHLAGGLSGLSSLEGYTPNAPRHARTVRDLAAARRIIELASDIAADRDGACGDPLAWIERQASRFAEAGSIQRHAAGPASAVEMAHEFVPRWKARHEGRDRGISTRWTDVNTMTAGLHAGDYVVVAARPSSGKSAFGQNIVTHCAVRQRIPALVFSLEMKRGDLWDRMISEVGRVDYTLVRAGAGTKHYAESMAQANADLGNSPIWIDDARGLTVAEVCARARQWRRDSKRGGQSKDAVIVVDYLQLVRPARKPESRQEAVAEVSRGFQALAGQIECPLVVMAQLNRETEKGNREPMMSDLRESGAIENDADVIAFIHRVDRQKADAPAGTTKLILSKQRNGPTGVVQMVFHGKYMRFEEVAQREDPR